MKITKIETSRLNSIDYLNLGFGKYFSDHMFLQQYKNGSWDEGHILPYSPLQMYPSTIVLHYAQTIFEGQKIFRGVDNKFRLFRPEENIARLNRSAERMCIPPVDPEIYMNALFELTKLDNAFIPKKDGTSLYIRPFIFGDEEAIGVKASGSYKFIIFTSPVASYYKEGLNPVRIKVCSNFSRVVKGGLGEAKAGANYAASLYAAAQAKSTGFAEVLWLDGIEHKYIDEVGAMNIMFVVDDTLITPKLEGTILPGITRDSVLKIAQHWNWNIEERPVTIKEILDFHKQGRLKEVFGTGTAAIISPVGELNYNDKKYIINNNKIGEKSQKLYDYISGIYYGKEKDIFNWTTLVE